MKLPGIKFDSWQWRLLVTVTAPLWIPVWFFVGVPFVLCLICIVGPVVGWVKWVKTGEFRNPFA